MERKNVWNEFTEKQLKELEEVCAGYIDFISEAKTERECVTRIVNDMEEAGYRELSTLIGGKKQLKPGDKVYAVNMNKAIFMAHIGKKPLSEGLNILGAHIDSPRLDIKQNPLYEDGGLAYLDTHYYGGVKKYQWVTLPLAIHGVFVKKNGETVELNVGEDPDDPVFFVSDLLIHLAQEQMEKKASKVIEGEALDIIIGSEPIRLGKAEKKKADEDEEKKEAKDAVKKGVLKLLKELYGVEEEDFLSAELEVVPAGRAREAGFDRSMVLGYGQDDRVCAYTSYQAMLKLAAEKEATQEQPAARRRGRPRKTDAAAAAQDFIPERTAVCLLVDKEEIGSVGATGMQSRFFENTVAELLELCGEGGDLNRRRCLASCNMLSSDVSSAFDPTYAASFDKKNVAYLGRGMVFNKYTGARGKSGSNDANAEYLAKLRNIFDLDEVHFQTAELGKVDLGGGGTIAYITALYGMNVIDSGVAVLNMHAPWECTSKADIYETMRGYLSFLKRMD